MINDTPRAATTPPEPGRVLSTEQVADIYASLNSGSVLASDMRDLLHSHEALRATETLVERGRIEALERELRLYSNMEACNAFICWECRTVKVKSDDWWARGGCEACGSAGYVLPFLIRPKEEKK